MKTETCSDCGEKRVIMLKMKAEVNGRTIDLKLCRGCLRKQVQAKQAQK